MKDETAIYGITRTCSSTGASGTQAAYRALYNNPSYSRILIGSRL